MAKPNSRSTLQDYCLRNLGAPVIEINVDEDQLEDRTDDAIQFYQEFNSDEGEAAFAPYPGGAVFNTAIGLGRLGIETQFLCGMSSDFLGDILRDGLDAAGVDHSPSPKLVAPCTVAFVKLVDGQATYAFYDENSAMRTLTVAPAIDANALFFCGISLVGDGCGDTF